MPATEMKGRGMKFTKAKMWAAAIGATATAIATAAATAQVVLDDGQLDASEYGTIATAAAVLFATIYGVWKTENKPIEPTNRR